MDESALKGNNNPFQTNQLCDELAKFQNLELKNMYLCELLSKSEELKEYKANCFEYKPEEYLSYIDFKVGELNKKLRNLSNNDRAFPKEVQKALLLHKVMNDLQAKVNALNVIQLNIPKKKIKQKKIETEAKIKSFEDYSKLKYGCDFCNERFSHQSAKGGHMHSMHPFKSSDYQKKKAISQKRAPLRELRKKVKQILELEYIKSGKNHKKIPNSEIWQKVYELYPNIKS